MTEERKNNEYPEDVACEHWRQDDLTFSLVNPERMSHYCGYVRFPTRPVLEGYGGFLRYVPVHGGITYADEASDGTMVYGFDCMHPGDESNPQMRDLAWLRAECERMALCIQQVANYEEAYLLAATEQEKAVIIDQYHTDLTQMGIEFNLTGNFLAMVGVVFGDL